MLAEDATLCDSHTRRGSDKGFPVERAWNGLHDLTCPSIPLAVTEVAACFGAQVRSRTRIALPISSYTLHVSVLQGSLTTSGSELGVCTHIGPRAPDAASC